MTHVASAADLRSGREGVTFLVCVLVAGIAAWFDYQAAQELRTYCVSTHAVSSGCVNLGEKLFVTPALIAGVGLVGAILMIGVLTLTRWRGARLARHSLVGLTASAAGLALVTLYRDGWF